MSRIVAGMSQALANIVLSQLRRPNGYRKAAPSEGGGGPPVTRVIWDTDLDSDIDDIAADALMAELVAKGEGQLIAVVATSNNVYAAPALKALTAYRGATAVPVGAYQGTSIGGGNSSLYTLGLRDRFRPATETRADYPDAVTVLTAALQAAPDQSVTYIVAGTSTTLAALLAAEPALCAAKIKLVSAMGGYFPNVKLAESNVNFDLAAANAVAQSGLNVVWAGAEIGNSVFTQIPPSGDTVQDPYKVAWDLGASLQNGSGKRQSWDLLSVLYGFRGLGDAFGISAPVDVSFAADGTTSVANPASKNRYLTLAQSGAAIGEALDAIIAQGITRWDVTGPLPLFETEATRASNASSSMELLFSEPASVTIVSASAAGYEVVGGTLNLPSLAAGSYTVTLRATDAKGNTRDTTLTDVTSAAGVTQYLAGEYLLNEGSGTTATDSSVNALNLSFAAGANAPTWTADGAQTFLRFDGADAVLGPANALYNTDPIILVSVARHTSVSGDQIWMARDDSANTPQQFQFKNSGGKLQLVGRGAAVTIVETGTGVVVANQWAMFTAIISGTSVVLRKNGVEVKVGTLTNPLPTSPSRLFVGARFNSGYTNGVQGDIAYAAIYSGAGLGSISAIEQRARDAAAARGITIP